MKKTAVVLLFLSLSAFAQQSYSPPTRAELQRQIDDLKHKLAEVESKVGELDLEAATKAEEPMSIDQAKKAVKEEPFAFADFTWLNGTSRTKESPLESKVFTGEF